MLADLLIAAALFLLGRSQFKYRAVKVAGVGAAVSTIALIPAFLAASILFVTLFKTLAILIALALMAIAKWKVFVAAKIGYFIAAIGGGILGVFSGPIGWIAVAFIVLLLFAYILEFARSAFLKIYSWILLRSAAMFYWVRSLSDQAASSAFGVIGFVVVFPLELILVAALPVWGLFELWDLLAGEVAIFADPLRANARLVIGLVFATLLYADYRTATARGRPVYPDLPDVLDVDGPVA